MLATSFTALTTIGKWTIEIIKHSEYGGDCEILPRRWVVEMHLRLGGTQSPPRHGLRSNHQRAAASLLFASFKLITSARSQAHGINAHDYEADAKKMLP